MPATAADGTSALQGDPDLGKSTTIARAKVRGPHHVFIEVDQRIEAATGYPILGLSHREAFPSAESRCNRALFDRARASRQPETYIATSPLGVRAWVTLVPLPGDVMEVRWEPLTSIPLSREERVARWTLALLQAWGVLPTPELPAGSPQRRPDHVVGPPASPRPASES